MPPHDIDAALAQFPGAPFSPDGYASFVFQWDRWFYEKRIQMAGFEHLGRVLDAGCGLGQFTAALGLYNREVIAIDQHDYMLQTTRIVVDKWCVPDEKRTYPPNVQIMKAKLPKLDFPDMHFNGVWCAGTIMFLDRDATMAEFHRVLAPGGRLYLGINSWGRWLYKAAGAFQAGKHKAVAHCLNALSKPENDGSRFNWLSLEGMDAFCTKHGFKLLQKGSDGTIDMNDMQRADPMFSGAITLDVADTGLVSLPNNLELVAERV